MHAILRTVVSLAERRDRAGQFRWSGGEEGIRAGGLLERVTYWVTRRFAAQPHVHGRSVGAKEAAEKSAARNVLWLEAAEPQNGVRLKRSLHRFPYRNSDRDWLCFDITHAVSTLAAWKRARSRNNGLTRK